MNNLTHLSELRALLARHGIAPKKKFGQNFLAADGVPARIAAAGVPTPAPVLEIGPGVGTLTRELSPRATRLVAVELDRALLPVLAETTADLQNLTIVQGDICKIDLRRLYEEYFGEGRVAVCANLPYYLTTPILTRLLESTDALPLSSITVLVQKEVADRLVAPPGSPAYGALTLAVAYRGRARKCFTLPGGCFYPPPAVDSTLVRVELCERPLFGLTPREEEYFFAAVRAAFAQRRKTLANALISGFPDLPPAALRELPMRVGADKNARGETLSAAQFAEAARLLAQMGG